jgi:hypothetical protein
LSLSVKCSVTIVSIVDTQQPMVDLTELRLWIPVA